MLNIFKIIQIAIYFQILITIQKMPLIEINLYQSAHKT
jgi:hypothetical protein